MQPYDVITDKDIEKMLHEDMAREDREADEIQAVFDAEREELQRIRKAAVNFYKRYMEAERKHIVSKRAILFLYDTRALLLDALDASDFTEE